MYLCGHLLLQTTPWVVWERVTQNQTSDASLHTAASSQLTQLPKVWLRREQQARKSFPFTPSFPGAGRGGRAGTDTDGHPSLDWSFLSLLQPTLLRWVLYQSPLPQREALWVMYKVKKKKRKCKKPQRTTSHNNKVPSIVWPLDLFSKDMSFAVQFYKSKLAIMKEQQFM